MFLFEFSFNQNVLFFGFGFVTLIGTSTGCGSVTEVWPLFETRKPLFWKPLGLDHDHFRQASSVVTD